MRKKWSIITLLAACSAIALFIIYPFVLSVRPSITYFPEDGGVRYLTAATGLESAPEAGLLNWTVQSETDRRAYLLQDFSLLYKNNRLIAIINHWKRNETSLWERKQQAASPGLFQSLSVHEAEIHSYDHIYGKVELSEDQLFIEKSGGHFISFVTAKTEQELHLADQYRYQIAFAHAELLRKASEKYGFNPADYRIFPLSGLTSASVGTLFPFDPIKARRITGQLWEGIYKTFLRGIETSQGQYEPATGSSMPLLLISQNDLLIIIETSRNHIALLKQTF